MIKVENIETFNFEGAIRGMRNPHNSWNKSDSYYCDLKHCGSCKQNPETRNCFQPDGFVVGASDLELMRRLYKAGAEHRKYLRQIFVSMDITAPLYYWKEADQYRINVTTNSCSTMHTIHKKEFTLDDFSHEHLCPIAISSLKSLIKDLNLYRDTYLASSSSIANNCLMADYKLKDKKEVWWQMIQLLPSSYNQKRTITMNYENVFNIIKQRSTHKLDEWKQFCDILKELPYIKEIGEFY